MSSTSVLLVILLDCLMLCQGNRPRVTYRDRGTMTKLYLPKPPADRISQIMFRNTTLFYASFGEIDGASVTQDGVRVRLTNTNAVLMINRVDFIHAGPYFIKMLNGNITGREKLLVVTDTPMNPHIKADTVSPVVPEAVTLCCNSTSRSKPDTHDLTLRFTWRINGTLATQLRFSANSSCLIIKSTVPNDRYNRFTCQAIEETQGYSGPPSMESDEFQLTPRYGPQFVDIDGAGSLSPMIMGDVCCPVVCSTDCNPSCVIEWWREGVLLPVHQTSDNQSRLLDKCPTKTREITYTCKVRLPENVGFTASMMERNFTVSVYYPPKITNMMYFDETDQFQPINTSDVITLPEAIKLVLRVDVDSNPNSDVTLLHGQHIVGTGVANGTTGRFSIHVDNPQCIHTGTYVVRATNFFKEKITAVHHSEGLFGLHVSCAPRVVRSTNRTVGLTRERYTAIPINVTVIANPSPSFEWSEGVSSLPVLKANLYTYIIRGIVEAKTMAEYREDHVNITNGLGQVLTVKFQIRPEGRT
ncbi:uncharacterized protein [Argopecten irradians]|uniref:uncharacterized protein n=1 Tax=Argopecten irradians TaxID=31199 RepID=UPI0037199ECB